MEVTRPSARWFIETQSNWFVENGIPDWFHGIITRKDAETLLANTTTGGFLIRVGESRIGYSLSYKTVDRYRHFMVDVLEGYQCRISGDTRIHQSLLELVKFHMLHPIHPYNEILSHPCGQKSHSATDYSELFEHNNDQITNKRHRKHAVKVKPPLPVRGPMDNGTETLPTPNSGQQNGCAPVPPRRYKSLDYFPQVPQPPIIPPTPAPQPVMRLYPPLPHVPLLANGVVPVLQNGQIHWNNANNVNPSLPPNTNAVPRFLTPVHGAMRMEAPINPHAVRLNVPINPHAVPLNVPTNPHAGPLNAGYFVPVGQPSTNPGPQHNVRNKLVPEEYKKPPPFAPGFY